MAQKEENTLIENWKTTLNRGRGNIYDL